MLIAPNYLYFNMFPLSIVFQLFFLSMRSACLHLYLSRSAKDFREKETSPCFILMFKMMESGLCFKHDSWLVTSLSDGLVSSLVCSCDSFIYLSSSISVCSCREFQETSDVMSQFNLGKIGKLFEQFHKHTTTTSSYLQYGLTDSKKKLQHQTTPSLYETLFM